MIKFTAFRTQKPRKFNYIPRYYDPEQEAREERRKQVLGIVDEPGGEYVPGQYIRSGQMRSRIQGASKTRRKGSVGAVRFMLVLILAGIAMWLWLDNVVILISALMVGFVAWRILGRN